MFERDAAMPLVTRTPRATRSVAPTSSGLDPLERLHYDVEAERHRLRARFAGVDLDDPGQRDRALEWIAAGAPVPDVEAYLRWLRRRAASDV